MTQNYRDGDESLYGPNIRLAVFQKISPLRSFVLSEVVYNWRCRTVRTLACLCLYEISMEHFSLFSPSRPPPSYSLNYHWL